MKRFYRRHESQFGDLKLFRRHEASFFGHETFFPVMHQLSASVWSDPPILHVASCQHVMRMQHNTPHEDLQVFIKFYSFMFTCGTPFCTPHRHRREHSSHRLLHMLTGSTIPNPLWRPDTVCRLRFWGALARGPGMGCPQPRPGIN